MARGGMVKLEEIFLPHVADSSGRTITWLSMPSKLYTVQFSSTLSPAVWTSLVTNLAGDPSLSNSYLDTASHAGNAGFYRVIQQ